MECFAACGSDEFAVIDGQLEIFQKESISTSSWKLNPKRNFKLINLIYIILKSHPQGGTYCIWNQSFQHIQKVVYVAF